MSIPVRRWLKFAAIALTLLYLGNNSTFYHRELRSPTLLAHRGMAQDFDRTHLEGDTCTAAQMLPPEHAYLENTLSSMAAAFERHADVVEFDIHPTTDGHFAVFHDWTLDCRTNGSGITREHSLTELKNLDIGHGYTADGGKTFPFRGKGFGLMPSLDEVLATFPGKRFLIHIKSNDPHEGDLLNQRLMKLTPEQRGKLSVYGGDLPISVLRKLVPDLQVMSKAMLKSCLLQYAGVGWTGYVPEVCHNMLLMVPLNVGPWLWGWPLRFVDRLASVGTQVYVVAPYQGEGFSRGINTAEEYYQLPPYYAGGIWTDHIERISPLILRPAAPLPISPR